MQAPGACVDHEGFGSSVFRSHGHDEPAALHRLNTGPTVCNKLLLDQIYGDGLAAFDENGAAVALLAPDTRQVSQIIDLSQWQGAILGSPLPLSESLAIASPQAVALIAGVIVLFVATYIVFQRQEVRA